MKESCVFYTALIGQPGTGKTPALNIVKDALREIEVFMQIDEMESKLLNGEILFLLSLSQREKFALFRCSFIC